VSVAGKLSGADLASAGQSADRLAWKWAAPLADVEVVEGTKCTTLQTRTIFTISV
jgi:hypothetical protein